MTQQKLISLGDLDHKIDLFTSFPYKQGQFQKRNWGHNLHSMCSFPSKIKPSIAHILVTFFTNEGETVLDPFSGTGTIPFEACMNARYGIGSDLSPLAYNLTKAKVNPPKQAEVEKRIKELSDFINTDNLTKEDLSDVPTEILPFYEEKTLKEILKARKYFLENAESDNITALLMASTAHLLHGNRPYALSRRSHNMFPIPPKGDFVYKSLVKSLTEKVGRLLSCPLPNNFIVGSAYCCPADNLPLPKNSADAIITSPPFLGTTDFLRHNRIRLWFCGWNYEKQEEMKSSFLENAVSTDRYSPILREFARLLKPQSLVIFHLGVVKKRDMAKEITPIAFDAGFDKIRVVDEDTSKLENHGRTDRGSTQKHQFLFLKRQANK
jgi:hypothetical protein